MNPKNTNKARFVLVLLALLTYSIQSVAFVGHMGFPETFSSDQVMKGCHGDNHEPQLSDATSSANSLAMNSPTMNSPIVDCCEDGCSMMQCHAPSALLSAINIPIFYLHKAQDHNVSIGFVAKVSSSLFRPPILR